MIIKKVEYVEVPKPKMVETPRMKALKRASNEAKKKLGIKGDLAPGDLINGAMTKRKLAILGLI